MQDGHRITILRRAQSDLSALGGLSFDEVIGDLTDAAAVDHAVEGCQVVFHAAAVIQYWDDRNAYQNLVNVEGTRHVVQSALRCGVERFVHISSVSAVGYALDGHPVDERCIYNIGALRMNYADSKYAAERVVMDGVEHGLDAVIVNPGTIYGPGDRRRITYIRGLSGPITSSGGMAIVDVEDVVAGAIAAWQRGKTGERYILAGENIPYQRVGRTFAKFLRRPGPRIVMPGWAVRCAARLAAIVGRLIGRRWDLSPTMARAAHIKFYFSNQKAREELGITFRPFADTARRTVEWMRNIQAM